MPIFYASEVAALLGLNKYKPTSEAMCRVIGSIAKFKPLIQRIKDETGSQTEKEIIESAPDHVKESLEKAVVSSIGAKSELEIVKMIETFKKETTESLLKNAIEGKSAPVEFCAAAERIRKNESTPEEESRKLITTPTVEVISQEIQKQRGTRMESSAEDKHAAATGKAITNRGAPVRYECAEYTIVGYIDGMQDGSIVETKNRKRFWKEPPPYDMIQLKCYMKMKGNVGGILLECFPSGEKRQTVLKWDEDTWSVIHRGLCKVALEIDNLDMATAEKLIRSVTKTD